MARALAQGYATASTDNAVLYTMGLTRTNESVRLFMAPGMMHCRGGDGTPDFDMIPELDKVYKGTGSTDAAESFVCGCLK